MPRILIVDDNEDFRISLSRLLELHDYEVTETPEAAKGVELYRKERFDIVITDIHMPNQDGIETIIQLKNEYPDVKIIALSGGGTLSYGCDYLEQAKELGADRSFNKLTPVDEIIAAIEELSNGQ